MKSLIIGLFIMVNTAIYSQPSAEFSRQWDQYSRKEYFKLNSSFVSNGNILSVPEKLVIGGLVDNLFNRPAESNKKLDEALKNHNSVLSDSVKMEIYQVQLINYVNLFEYSQAAKLTTLVLRDYGKMIDSGNTEELKNSGFIWESASGLKPQTCTKTGNTEMEIKNDLAGLKNIKLKVNSIESEFVFDTGANFSTITASLAKEMKLIFLKEKIQVGTITGIKIETELAYAESLEIGNIKYRNVLFLVVPDEALSFAGGMYKISGIIGLPLIKEMKEISFTSTHLIVPQTAEKKETTNMCIFSFTPMINVTYNNDSMSFTFDTGARRTILYSQYYEVNKNFIDSKYEMGYIEIEGAGGKQTVKGFTLDKVYLNAGGINSELKDIRLCYEDPKEGNKYIYGNLGRDFFSGADKITMNFEYMYIEFSNN